MFTRRTSDSAQEKAWYYRWFRPDVVVGVGYWGHTPDLVLHPMRYGIRPVPWLVADGYIANYGEVLNSLQLILVTSNWVRETYIRDGIDPKIIEVLPGWVRHRYIHSAPLNGSEDFDCAGDFGSLS